MNSKEQKIPQQPEDLIPLITGTTEIISATVPRTWILHKSKTGATVFLIQKPD